MEDNGSKISTEAPRRKPWWRRLLKWLLISAGCIVLLAVIAVGAAVWLLTPEALTPMVSKYSADYLDADVTAGKVELSFWKTFPKVSLDIDDLTVVSRKLRGLPQPVRDSMPEYADTLLTLRHFSGGVNVWAMMGGTVMLYDVELESPKVNIVQVNDTLANYMIVRPTADTDTAPAAMPYISVNRFAITGGAPVRFFSLADSMDVALNLGTTQLDGADAPLYNLDIQGKGSGHIAELLDLPVTEFGVNGRIDWNQREPARIALRDFDLAAAGVKLRLNTALDFEKELTVNSLEVIGSQINVGQVLDIVPQHYLGEWSRLKTDIVADLALRLLSPYTTGSTALPSMQLELKIPGGTLSYDRVNLNNLRADIDARINGSDINASTVDVRELTVEGRSLGFTVSGTATNLIDDPSIDGSFKGRLNFSSLPSQLWRRLRCTARGMLVGDAAVRMRMSDLTPKRFHKVKANGNLALRDFSFATADSSLTASTRKMSLAFGTDARVTIADSLRADSLLKVSITADTLAFAGDGIVLSAADASLVAAARNTRQSADTNNINPIGMAVRAGSLRMHSAGDSVNVRLRDAAVKATLTRYGNSSRAPHLAMSISAGRARYSDPESRVSLSEASAALSLHPAVRRTAPVDSATRAMRRARRLKADSIAARQATENMDFELDKSVASWLRKWKAHGSVSAKRGRLLTPYFPVKNRIRNLDMTFSTDSVVIRNTKYSMGSSDFLINGSITNIARALTSRRGSPLKIDFDIKSDTVNINEIYEAIMRGSAYADKAGRGEVTRTDASDDDVLQATLDSQAAAYGQAAFVVPSNIDAHLNISAREVLYADIWFQRLAGKIDISGGAVHLDRLAGYTPIGSMALTALYSAPNKHNINFAAGIVVRSLHLKQFLHLLPEIDSVLPLLREVNGIITADAAMSTEIDSMMNLKFHTFDMVLKLMGDSLVLVDSETFRSMAKWLMFKHKDRNIINSMKVELMIKDTRLDVFPFVFDIDRYRIGVSGHNTLDMDLDYHVAVLKSPLPFKFGINIKGKPGHLKIRLGRANFNENKIAFSHQLTDTLRMNLVNEIKNVFKFGARNGKRTRLMMESPKFNPAEFSVADTLTHADSVIFIQGGAIEGQAPPFPMENFPKDKAKKIKKKRH